MEEKIKKYVKKHERQLRFAVVGIANTAIDFGILFALVGFGSPALASNFISTFVAMAFSFTMNKKYTFKDDGQNHTSQIFRFLIITLFGLWVIQPILIEGATFSLRFIIIDYFVILFVAKCLATGASMVWNYLMYSKFVFRKKS